MKIRTERVFSPEQQAGITTFGKNVCVFAGAGSGKTTLLVERFLRAVTEKGAQPDRILAITFTEKAANQMKTRLFAECRARGLDDFRRALENAYIGTIHGFCARLLKENPIESGIDPYFQILGEGEAEILRQKVMDRLFEEAVGNEAWLAILRDYGEPAVRAALVDFYDKGRALAGETGLWEMSGALAGAEEERAELAREIDHFLEGFDGEKISESEAGLKAAALEMRKVLSTPQDASWESLRHFAGLKKRLHKRIKKHKEGVERIHGLADSRLSRIVEALALPVKKEFLAMLDRFTRAFDEEKKKRACHDFEDLLLFAYRLLSAESPEKKEIRARYRELFSYIFVDEYQDTSPLQAKIIHLLVNANNLFVVGDLQQSIYSFRHAEPELFRSLATSDSPDQCRIRLSDNYRSRLEILSFVNRLFEKIFPPGDFMPLEAKNSFSPPAQPVIELLRVLRTEENKVLDRARVLEARSLAARIRELVDSGRFRPEQIAILFKSTTSSYLYEKELADAGIPFTVSKGRGFYEKQEVADLINLLRLVENPDLDIPLAAVLRSPLVGISEDGLFWIARAVKNEGRDKERPLSTAFLKIGGIPGLSEADARRFTDFYSLLESLRKNKASLRPSEILQQALSETDYEAKILTTAEGPLKIANLRKLLDICRSLEEKGAFGIEDFTRLLKGLSEREMPEAEARVEGETPDAVTISTIHAAKGLEFPCVIIADMGARGKNDGNGSFLASPKAGFGICLKDPLLREWAADFTFLSIKNQTDTKEKAEDNRLLYVAMTRAEEHLILSGSAAEDAETGEVKDDGSWMGRVLPLLDFDGAPMRDIEIKKELLAPPALSGPPLARIFGSPDWPKSSDEKEAARILRRLVVPVKPYDEMRDATVTDVLNRGRAPQRGAPTTWEEETEIPEEGLPRNEYGTWFHRAMEELVRARPARVMPLEFFLPGCRTLSEAERGEMHESLIRFWKGPWGDCVRQARQCYTELPFIYKTKHGVLKGQIDLLIHTRADEWVVLDYKTHRLAPGEKEAVAAEYELQLLLYAFVFKKLYGRAPAKGVLYFSVLHDWSERPYAEAVFQDFENSLNELFLRAMRAVI